MANLQQQMELTTSKLVVNVSENKVKNEEMEVRLGHLEAKSLQTNEGVDKCKTVTNDIMERLGDIEAKLVAMETHQAATGTTVDYNKPPINGPISEPVITEIYERKYI